jgi:hypothetical protein
VHRKIVAVSPPTEQPRRARLFGALEEALPVRFEPRKWGEWRGVDAAILMRHDEAEPQHPPVGLRCLVAPGWAEPDVVTEGEVDLACSHFVDARLRGRSLRDARAAGVGGRRPLESGTVLASCGGQALWTRRGSIDHVALAPDELASDESLRDALVPGRWLSLLPIVHFLREVAAELAWEAPPTRAAFMIDDPNLHWPSYGYARFGELARSAEEHGYHLAIATIPLDAWFVHPGAARLFRSPFLSLLVHGNDHAREELTRPQAWGESFALLAQALRRIAALERRARLAVDRLMVPPHGLCVEQMMRAMLLVGFEGLCYAWSAPRSADRPLAGWEPADLLTGGFPVFPRLPLAGPPDELVLRSFLGQPVIAYAHHSDLADGLDVLADLAAFVNREEGVLWMSAASIARSNYRIRHEGTTLRVRLYARKIELSVPEGVEQVLVELPSSHGEPERETTSLTSERGSASFVVSRGVAGPFPVESPGHAEISLTRVDAVDPSCVPSPPRRIRPILRRSATESRDRLAPLMPRLPRGRARTLRAGD